jgi:hypothetical protein
MNNTYPFDLLTTVDVKPYGARFEALIDDWKKQGLIHGQVANQCLCEADKRIFNGIAGAFLGCAMDLETIVASEKSEPSTTI